MKKGETAGAVEVDGSQKSSLRLLASRESVVGYEAGQKPKIEKKLDLPSSVSAPVKKGDVVGHMICYADGKAVDRVELIAAEDVKYHTFWMTVKDWFRKLTKGLF